VVRCVVGGAALRDVATALGWSGALSESAVAGFGVRFVWASNGRRLDGDITDRRLVPARSRRQRAVVRDVTELRDEGGRQAPGAQARDGGPRAASRGRLMSHIGTPDDPDAPSALRAHPNRPPQRERTTSQRHETPIPLTPLDAKQTTPQTPVSVCTEHQQQDASPKRSQHQGLPRDQRSTTSVSGGPLPVPASDTTGAPDRSSSTTIVAATTAASSSSRRVDQKPKPEAMPTPASTPIRPKSALMAGPRRQILGSASTLTSSGSPVVKPPTAGSGVLVETIAGIGVPRRLDIQERARCVPSLSTGAV
jgi:hypothetical protein